MLSLTNLAEYQILDCIMIQSKCMKPSHLQSIWPMAINFQGAVDHGDGPFSYWTHWQALARPAVCVNLSKGRGTLKEKTKSGSTKSLNVDFVCNSSYLQRLISQKLWQFKGTNMHGWRNWIDHRWTIFKNENWSH